MTFCMNNLILALSYALDFIEIDLLGVSTNHSKRVAYMTASIAKAMGYCENEVFDLITLALLHDIGRCKNWLEVDDYFSNSVRYDREHCTEGEKIIEDLGLTNEKDIIRYHHEFYNGLGMFQLKGDDIPVMAQIITMADQIEKTFKIMQDNRLIRDEIRTYVKAESGEKFHPKVVEGYLKASENILFWLELLDDNIQQGLYRIMPQVNISCQWKDIRKITSTFGEIIDMKSSFTKNHSSSVALIGKTMAEHYGMSEDEKQQFLIACDLHDLGKLVVSNKILHKESSLEDDEFSVIKEHPFYTRKCLQEIEGFENIANWAGNHHEKLNGLGYPYNKSEEALDFHSRLLMCIDIYQALVEDRPYREGFSHKKAIGILNNMVDYGELDKSIVDEMDQLLK